MGAFVSKGYTLRHVGFKPGWPRWHQRAQYEFDLDWKNPLTYRKADRVFIQPDRHGFTDMGSIPEPVQLIIPKDRFLASFIIHDSACRERGLYFGSCPVSPFVFAPISSIRAHSLLREMILAEGGAPWQARLVWAAVRAFGPRFACEDKQQRGIYDCSGGAQAG